MGGKGRLSRHIPANLTTTNANGKVEDVARSPPPRPGCSRTKTLNTGAHSTSSTCPRPVLPFLRVSVPASYRSLSSSYGCRRIGNPMPVLATLFRMLASIPLYFAHRVLMKDIPQHREAARLVPAIPSSSFALRTRMYDRKYGAPALGSVSPAVAAPAIGAAANDLPVRLKRAEDRRFGTKATIFDPRLVLLNTLLVLSAQSVQRLLDFRIADLTIHCLLGPVGGVSDLLGQGRGSLNSLVGGGSLDYLIAYVLGDLSASGYGHDLLGQLLLDLQVLVAQCLILLGLGDSCSSELPSLIGPILAGLH
ncbi:hypothetical protein C8J57DRAFT_1504904 [Mycena rebaudengoi]|nr:hypothetical protein C8J57DRAFT_1504904 [Mycena rebaudengoi]